MQNMVILGATGSIGASTLSVISANPSVFSPSPAGRPYGRS